MKNPAHNVDHLTVQSLLSLSGLYRTLALCLVSLVVTACDSARTDPAAALLRDTTRELTENGTYHPCERSVETSYASLVASARCMTFTRAENPADPDGRQLQLKVMVLPSVRPVADADPLVILVGGPGQAATEAGLIPAQLLAAARQRREVLLLDQRGTGSNSPLQCDFGEESLTEAPELNLLINEQEELIDTCLQSLDADPRFYTTDLAVEDLEALRQALGYSRLNLWGGSYGTRVALAYLGQYPQAVRSVVLDGVAPVDILLPLHSGRDASAAFDRIIALCENDSDCGAAWPDLRNAFERLLARLRFSVPATFEDGLTGEQIRGSINEDSIRLLLRTMLYSREYDRLIPWVIQELSEGRYEALSALSAAETGVNQGMFLSVICSEDYSRMSEEAISDAINADDSLGGNILVTPVILACEQWPTRDLPENYFEPVQSDVPVLVFSGELDPVTPEVWGQLVTDRLDNARHFTVPGVAHITLPYGCVSSLVNRFIDNPDPDLDADCLSEQGPRPFFLSSGGAAMDEDTGVPR